MESSPSKSRALAESLLVWAFVMSLLWVAKLAPDFTSWQKGVFGQSFLTSAACLIVPPLLILILTRRDVGAYGIAFKRLKQPLAMGLRSLIVLVPATGAFPLLGALQLSAYDWKGGLILALFFGASLPLVGLAVRGLPTLSEQSASNRHVSSLVLFLGIAIMLAAATLPYTRIVASILYAMLFVGLGEELLFRGYIQTRVTQAFGRPRQVLGVQCGWGLIVAALLFGLSHVFSPSNPFHMAWGLWTFAFGLVCGYLREKSGNIVASAVAHGVLISIPFIFSGGVQQP
jgi:membrane protease YdiL (CAAX protease family)